MAKMSASASRSGEEAAQHTQNPGWIRSFVRRSFSGPCPSHHFPNNEINRYCITCDVSLCNHCIQPGDHADHQVLRIYKIIHKDSVRLDDMKKYFNCAGVQAYKNNKKLDIVLNPLPHTGSEARGKTKCDICKRVLQQKNYRYCSIACKVQAISNSTHGGEPQTKRKRARKGVPRRAKV